MTFDLLYLQEKYKLKLLEIMGNLANTSKLFIGRIDKGGINENSMLDILAQDDDFDGEEGLEASKDIFKKHEHIEDEFERVSCMVAELSRVDGFIGCSSAYGDHEEAVIETEFEYVIAISVVM